MARRGGARRLRFHLLPSVLFTAAILLVPALLYAWGRQADAFAIERIAVAGGRRVPERQALKLLRREFLGRNLFTVTTEDVTDCLADFCYLAAVEVDRDFPTTLRVRLVEHKPALYVLARGRWFVIADSGHVVCELRADGTVPGAPGASSAGDAAATSGTPGAPSSDGATSASSDGVPAVAGPAGASPSPIASGVPAATTGVPTGGPGAEGAASREQAVAAALCAGPPAMRPRLPRMAVAAPPAVGARTRDADVGSALRALAALSTSLRARVTVVRAGPAGGVSFDLAGGPRVEFGDGARLAAKALALRAVLAAYRRGGVTPTTVDVSVPDRPLAWPALRS